MPDLSPNPFCNKLPPVTKVPSARQSAASINTDAESARCLFRKQQKDITSTLANHLSCRLLSPNQIVMPGLPSEVTSTVDWLPIITSHHLSPCTASRSIPLWTKSSKAVETCRTVPCLVAVLSRCLARWFLRISGHRHDRQEPLQQGSSSMRSDFARRWSESTELETIPSRLIEPAT